VRVVAQTDNVAGVKIPKFEQHVTGGEAKMNLTGLGKGGQQVQQCRKVCLLEAHRALQTSFLEYLLCYNDCLTERSYEVMHNLRRGACYNEKMHDVLHHFYLCLRNHTSWVLMGRIRSQMSFTVYHIY